MRTIGGGWGGVRGDNNADDWRVYVYAVYELVMLTDSSMVYRQPQADQHWCLCGAACRCCVMHTIYSCLWRHHLMQPEQSVWAGTCHT